MQQGVQQKLVTAIKEMRVTCKSALEHPDARADNNLVQMLCGWQTVLTMHPKMGSNHPGHACKDGGSAEKLHHLSVHPVPLLIILGTII